MSRAMPGTAATALPSCPPAAAALLGAATVRSERDDQHVRGHG
ncbi:MAG: hypothetical protein WKG32_12225 [Gemmatimonadaceae bacterium]